MEKSIFQEYYHIEGKPALKTNVQHQDNYVCAEVVYEDGKSCFGNAKKRGYYICVREISRYLHDGFISTGFGNTGVSASVLLFETGRQSKNKEEEAIDRYQKQIKDILSMTYGHLTLRKED